MASSTFPTANTVSAQVASGGGLSGDGSSGNKLAISGFSGTTDTEILFNSSGSVAGAPGMVWNASNTTLSLGDVFPSPVAPARMNSSYTAMADFDEGLYAGITSSFTFTYGMMSETGQLLAASDMQAIVAVPHVYGVAAESLRGFYFYAPDLQAGATLTTIQAFYSEAQGGKATNPYHLWADDDGVFRIRADNTFNSVYQAIPALYNPQFTKYTPGAANYERIIMGQWSSNIAQIGTEKGGTGTLRKVQLIGAGLLTNATLIPTADPHVVGQVWNNSGVMTISAG